MGLIGNLKGSGAGDLLEGEDKGKKRQAIYDDMSGGQKGAFWLSSALSGYASQGQHSNANEILDGAGKIQEEDRLARLKEIAGQNSGRGLQAPAVQMAQQAPGYSFQYRNPSAQGAAPGQQYGVMAQDLERTPAGRSVVMPQPDGTKMVDTGRLSMQNTAAIGELGNEIEKLKQYGGQTVDMRGKR